MSSSIFGHPLNPCAAINKETPPGAMLLGALVRVTRFERAISTSQMWRGTSSATPGYSVFDIIPRWGRKSKIFLSVVNPVVKAVFRPCSATSQNPANARVSRLSGLSLFWSWMVSGPLPNVARYQLRYTRIFSFCYYTTLGAKIKVFPVCGHSCGQGRFRPGLVIRRNPANARVARLSGLRLLRSWMVSPAPPNHARYQLRYTRIRF